MIKPRYIRILKEDIDFSNFEQEDYDDIYFFLIKEWLKAKNIDPQKLPMSLILKKYSEEFMRDMLGDDIGEMEDDEISGTWDGNRSEFIQLLIKKGLYEMPLSIPKGGILPQYMKLLMYSLKKLNIPGNPEIVVTENVPLEWDISFRIRDFDLVAKEGKYMSNYLIRSDVDSIIENNLGLEVGNPLHGDIKFETHIEFESDDFNLWKKKFVKDLKSNIAEIEEREYISSFRVKMEPVKINLTVSFKQDIWGSRFRSRKIIDNITSIVRENMGFPGIEVH